MRKFLLLLGAIFFLAPLAGAQVPTAVTGTITDVNGLPYSFAKVSAQLIPSTATPTVIGVGGIPRQIGGQQNGTADVNGTFNMNLFCNTAGGGCSVISPASTTWQITVNETGITPPLGTGPQFCTATLTITGASQSVTASFSACPALSLTTGGACATCLTSASTLPNKSMVTITGGPSRTVTSISFPDWHYLPAANCVNTVAGVAWSVTGATPAAACRAGTNNKEAYLTWGAADTAQISIAIPLDYDTSLGLNVSLHLTSTDTTVGHTIIMQVAWACSAGDGTVTDDTAFAAPVSFLTVTLTGTANAEWRTGANTGFPACTAGGFARAQISRTADTATNVRILGAGITIPRLLVVQAN